MVSQHILPPQGIGAQVEYPGNRCVHELFEQRVKLSPAATAITFKQTSLSYLELNQKANRLAHYLIDQGVGAGDFVGLCFERSPEMLIALLAVLKAGAAYVPMEPDYPVARLQQMMTDSGLKRVLTTARERARLPTEAADRIQCIDDPAFPLLLEGYDLADIDIPARESSANHLAYMIYTSGSTGMPKGVLITHSGLINYLSYAARYFSEGETGGVVSSPLGFDATITTLLTPLLLGMPVLLLPQTGKEIEEMAGLIFGHQQPLVFKLTPAHLDAIGHYVDDNTTTDVRHRFVVGGEQFAMQTAKRWKRKLVPNGIFENEYGPTETVVGCSVYTIATEDDLIGYGSAVPIGTPIINTRLYVLDNKMQPVAEGEAGELCIGGAGVARGYLYRPDLTAEKFVADPFADDSAARVYKTGDLARWLPDGNLEFLGRIDRQIKIRGFRVEPGDIESQLLSHAAIKEAVVLADDGNGSAKRLLAYIVPTAKFTERTLTEELRGHLSAVLPDYMVPSRFILVDSIPLTSNGKVDRTALPKPDAAYFDESYAAPKTDAEHALCGIWQDVLGLARVGVDDNFYELGGDSILSIQIVARANKAGMGLSTRQLFESQTIRLLARQAKAGTHASVSQEASRGQQVLLPVHHDFFAGDDIDLHHFNQSMLLQVPADFSAETLKTIVAALYLKHDVLRLRFKNHNGMWQAEYRDEYAGLPEQTLGYERLDGGTARIHADDLNERCLAVQKTLSLKDGPLFRAVWFAGDESGWLLLVLHHTIVDGVSWRILSDDIETAYRQLQAGEPVWLGAKTASYQHWAQLLERYARSGRFQGERAYWLETLRAKVPALPKDDINGDDDRVATTAIVEMALDQESTGALLGSCHRSYRTQINDLLLSALLMAVNRWAGVKRIGLDLEGHGREMPDADIDISETVGWFTSVYPVVLEADHADDPATVIKSVKERLHAVPNKGIGYGVLCAMLNDDELVDQAGNRGSEIVFNYLGQFDQQRSKRGTAFRCEQMLAGGTGGVVSPNRKRSYRLGVNGMVTSGCLRFVFDYSDRRYRRRTIEKLAEEFKACLQAVIAHCRSLQHAVHTPSDFPLAQVSQTELDLWQRRYPNMTNLYASTPMQQGLLFHSLMDPSAYITHYWFTLSGRLDVECFRRAWQSLVHRHDILRTAFVGERFDQLVLSEVELPWQQLDWRKYTVAKQSDLFDAYRKQDKSQGYDFARAPLLRLSLIRLSDDSHRLLLSNHHALLDGWSLPLVLLEVMQGYRGQLQGTAEILPAPAPFYTYVDWLHQQDIAAAKRYWQAQLSGVQMPTAIAAGQPPQDAGEPQSRETVLTLSGERTQQLQRLAQRTRTTFNTVIQCAWAYLLHRYSGLSQVVFGITQAGRPADLPEVDEIVGLFINTVPVHINFAACADSDVDAWLRQEHQAAVEREAFNYLPLTEIQKLGGAGNVQLFDTLLVFEAHTSDLEAELSQQAVSCRVHDLAGDEQTNYGLTLAVFPGSELKLKLAYRSDRFADATVGRLLSHLDRILQGMLNENVTRVNHLPFLSEAEQRQLQLEWSGETDDSVDCCAHELFQASVRRDPDAVAVVFDSERLTYARLNERANSLAHYLIAQGVLPGTAVGLCMEKSLQAPIGLLAILKAGAVYVPLDPTYPAPRLRYMADDADVKWVLSQAHLKVNERFGDRCRVICIDDAAVSSAIDGCSVADPVVGTAADCPAYIIYTSGSTGKPKGVVVEHAALVRHCHSINLDYGIDSDDTVFQFASFGFDVSIEQFFTSFAAGASLLLPDANLIPPRQCIDYLARHRASVVNFPPAYWQELLEQETIGNLAGVRLLILGGEALTYKIAEQTLALFPDMAVINAYGPTETVITSLLYRLPASLPATSGFVPIGRPRAGTRVAVMSPDLMPLPVGVPGELCIGGSELALGYLNLPELTAEKFIHRTLVHDLQSRLYRTGDVVRQLADGNIEFLGRVDQQVKIRGFRIELGEIENTLAAHADVRAAVVAAQKTASGEPQLVAHIVPNEPQSNDADFIDTLRAHLKTLPDYMLPQAWSLLDSLPLTANGKVDRAALPLIDVSMIAGSRYRAASNSLERSLCRIWQEVLRLSRVGIADRFFDVGGDSLKAIRVHRKIVDELQYPISITDLFTYPTIADLAAYLAEPASGFGESQASAAAVETAVSRDIAVIGMAGRFPGARTIDEFWLNVRNGVESIEFYSDEQLRQAGIDEDLLRQPDYVKSGYLLQDIDLFDADYFGFTPKEAEITDPQLRILLECAVEALESAGYGNAKTRKRTGVFVATSGNRYLNKNLLTDPALVNSLGEMSLLAANDPSAAATKISYKLNLKGPSINVLTACSSSLVAVHQACTNLLLGECDMALAGASAIMQLQRTGYLYEESGIMSPDGRCYAFDRKAAGTRSGSGAGLVLLKRLQDALRDGDPIQAVIKGSAVNNDGDDKVGYTAPSVQGQVEVIRAAHAAAQTDPATIRYIEAHGTGTQLGDPIEISALTKAFQRTAINEHRCAIGAVKSNIGHLDAAAGVVGLIKTIESLRHKEIPPTINFAELNPAIDFQQSPFYINTQAERWIAADYPRRAAVSSFGIGGTNAHVIVEEAPLSASASAGRRPQLLALSAKTATALQTVRKNLCRYLRNAAEVSLTDIAHTLQVGREAHDHRAFVLADDVSAAADMLHRDDCRDMEIGVAGEWRKAPIVFMFSGQGSQYPGMARDLYRQQAVFRDAVDQCAELLAPYLRMDIRDAVFAVDSDIDSVEPVVSYDLNQTVITQPALFVIEYALTRLLQSCGVKPDLMIGHSLGEYVAACVAGVLTLEDALRLVATRARLMQSTVRGCMLSVPVDFAALQPMAEAAGCSIAAVNAPDRCVASGSMKSIECLLQELERKGIEGSVLRTSHAYHSSLMDEILDNYRDVVKTIRFSEPAIPYISNVTGQFITAADVGNSDYWVRHLRETVNFSAGMDTLLGDDKKIFIEVGPGNTLQHLLKRRKQQCQILSTTRHPNVEKSDEDVFLQLLGRLWLLGLELDWRGLHAEGAPRRVNLPTYPFERKRYWIDGRRPAQVTFPQEYVDARACIMQAARSAGTQLARSLKPVSIVLIEEHETPGDAYAYLQMRNQNFVFVEKGACYLQKNQNSYVIHPQRRDDYSRLIDSLSADGYMPMRVIDMWKIDIAPDGGMLRREYSDVEVHAVAARAAVAMSPSSMPVDVPRNDVEKRLHGLWSDLLGIEEFGRQESFFELGGDSLLATRLLTLLKKEKFGKGLEYSLSKFFDAPTIESVANNIYLHMNQSIGSAGLSVGSVEVVEEGYL